MLVDDVVLITDVLLPLVVVAPLFGLYLMTSGIRSCADSLFPVANIELSGLLPIVLPRSVASLPMKNWRPFSTTIACGEVDEAEAGDEERIGEYWGDRSRVVGLLLPIIAAALSQLIL